MPKKRKIRPHILIIVEGETERNYFRAIKADTDYAKPLSSVKIKISKKGQASKKVAQDIIDEIDEAKRDNNPYHKSGGYSTTTITLIEKKAMTKQKKQTSRLPFLPLLSSNGTYYIS